jgi:hypothetical protein
MAALGLHLTLQEPALYMAAEVVAGITVATVTAVFRLAVLAEAERAHSFLVQQV